ncbi:hypothetical protein ACIBI9_67340 [Nonomuraea sp. NPDC050451]|uniref:hypothetical protein n=1 Tax=Nonomuraea sp. NPDC050451 TaxID=3364364 RepID=UPI0037A05298
MTLVETGTRAVIGAVFGPTATGETNYAKRLLHLLKPDIGTVKVRIIDTQITVICADGIVLTGS